MLVLGYGLTIPEISSTFNTFTGKRDVDITYIEEAWILPFFTNANTSHCRITFQGHRGRVIALEMSPVDDTFMSGGMDNSVRLWDLRASSCSGIMHVQGKPVLSFDPEGLVFAVGVQSEMVKLYDLRSYDKGPFATFKMPRETK